MFTKHVFFEDLKLMWWIVFTEYPSYHWIGTIQVELAMFVAQIRSEDSDNWIEHQYRILLDLHSSFVQCNSKAEYPTYCDQVFDGVQITYSQKQI